MCGIGGFVPRQGSAEDDVSRAAERMCAALGHRGPDDRGIWQDEMGQCVLVHTRLSIVDLSSAGSQPMVSFGGRFVFSFNGEIYNHDQLRRALMSSSVTFRGGSDTEVALAAIEEWGLETALSRFNGMFAFGLWDRELRQLTLARDRLGIKPIYYGSAAGSFVFASELKAIRSLPGFDNSIDRQALDAFLRYGYVPEPLSIFDGLKKLAPGHIVTLKPDNPNRPLVHAFWSLEGAVRSARAVVNDLSDEESVDELDSVLRDAVRVRMQADVPVGAFLSGGYDSSTIVALMQAQSHDAIPTFTVRLTDQAYNEADEARAVAEHLGTAHNEVCVSSEDVMAVIPNLPQVYDEPFADSSQVPTYLVSQLARKQVTVTLSGDGGDELFGGYNRHLWGPRLIGAIKKVPRPARLATERLLTSVSPSTWDRSVSIGSRLMRRSSIRTPGDKVHKLARLMSADSEDALYDRLTTHWAMDETPVLGVDRVAASESRSRIVSNTAEQFMLWDLAAYLPGDILTKVDRASMAVGLEARVPFLDHRVLDLAWQLPLDLKIRDSKGKWILRQVLYRYVPRELVDRPKTGFGIPIDSWLRGPLNGWAGDLLTREQIEADGYLDADLIQEKWREHLSGRRSWTHELWSVLMFGSWLSETGTRGNGQLDCDSSSES